MLTAQAQLKKKIDVNFYRVFRGGMIHVPP